MASSEDRTSASAQIHAASQQARPDLLQDDKRLDVERAYQERVAELLCAIDAASQQDDDSTS
jgi:hypothetical protein